MLRFTLLLLLAGTAYAEPGSTTAAMPSRLEYSRDIKPILADKCFACHGPDPSARKAGLRLDVREEAVKAKAIVPGKPTESELIARIHHDPSSTEFMPPKKTNKTLSAAEKELLVRWIQEGAEYRGHWSFEKPVRPPVPSVKNPSFARTDLDRFILARLEAAGLQPRQPADKSTLIRRVSLDLRGFAPTVAELDEFLNDTRPDAYERMVDRMLADPHYGEKMTQLWLDLARFGDTSGYHFDSTRQMWLWRDQVIKAFNSNQRFDQFTIEQLAGDLLPNATREQKIASGFNRNTRFNEEGGADPEEFVVRYTVDRTNTLGQVWLGLTLGCAECHSHKYDPISQKEYYQLYAFFTGIREPMTSMNHNQPLPPLLKVPTPSQEATLASLRTELAQVDREITQALRKLSYKEPTPEALATPSKPRDVVWIDDDTPKGANLQGDGPNPWQWISDDKPGPFSGKRVTKRSGAGLHQHYFSGASEQLTIGEDDVLFAYVYLDPKDPPKSIMLQFNDGSWEHRAYWGEDKCFLAGNGDADNHRKIGPLPKLGEWVRLEVPAKKVGLKAGAKLNGWAFTQFDGTVLWDKAGIVQVPADQRPLRSLALWETKAKGDKSLPGSIQGILNRPAEKRTPDQQTELTNYYLRYVYLDTREIFDPLHTKQKDLSERMKKIDDEIPHTMISEEMEKPRPAFILLRGDFLQRGEQVSADVPAILPPLPKDAPRNRLTLAKWLVSPDHPLTARVTVNRLWAQLFGSGIVRTLGDFGTQGDYPSHPELLDWLATEFIASGWDVKGLLKQILLSATYRQASTFGDGIPDADPHNRLLHRAPRYRLSAEEIRDNSLRIAGLLNERIGGPAMMPYQPGDFYVGKNESWGWRTSSGSDQYRRGLYTFWRRTSLHPMYAIFDAPSREECTVARPRTNTPLQALVTLNDPTFVEAARVFAQRILTEAPPQTEARLRYAFRAALSREPSALEKAVLMKKLTALEVRYAAKPTEAEAVTKVGQAPLPQNLKTVEIAAWTGIANILLNLDETITRE